MALFSIEHSKAAYRADFAFYILAILGLTIFLVATVSLRQAPWAAALLLIGLALWSLIEYVMHRYLFHHVQPFKTWHAVHHQRPQALIYAPTLLIGTSIGVLIFWPTFWLGGLWVATALTLGFLIGNLVYSSAHHAVHHVRATHPWLRRLKLWHALHHHQTQRGVCFGVTSGFWDRVLGSAP